MIVARDLKVIDVEMALSLINGYESIYQKIIGSFMENQKNLIQTIKNLLPNNLDEARRLVHSCKGISKNLGSLPLYDVSAKLEQAILNGNLELIDKYFQMFQQVFQDVLHDLTKIQFIN
ncbi:MAG: Hpt domain-containing protein [Bacilli bacterium]|nr:Hpt domain-containing protein [Bacilli bacterium]